MPRTSIIPAQSPKRQVPVEVQSQIRRQLKGDGMKRPIILRAVEGDFSNLLSEKEIARGKTIQSGDYLVVDVPSKSFYSLF